MDSPESMMVDAYLDVISGEYAARRVDGIEGTIDYRNFPIVQGLEFLGIDLQGRRIGTSRLGRHDGRLPGEFIHAAIVDRMFVAVRVGRLLLALFP